VFLGKAYHTLDEKGRIVLPSRFRGPLEDGCVVTKARDDGSLLLYPEADFASKAEEMTAVAETAVTRRMARVFFSDAEHQKPDKQGRVMLTEELRRFARLETGAELAILGIKDHIEIWNPAAYESDRALAETEYRDKQEVTPA
jgi:MraZ protein